MTSKDASKRAISRIIGGLNGEDPCRFNEILREEKAKASDGVKRIKLMGKENESAECQQNLPEPPLSIVPAASSSFNTHVPNWNFSSQGQYSAPFNSQGSYPMASTHTVYHPNHYTVYQPNQYNMNGSYQYNANNG